MEKKKKEEEYTRILDPLKCPYYPEDQDCSNCGQQCATMVKTKKKSGLND